MFLLTSNFWGEEGGVLRRASQLKFRDYRWNGNGLKEHERVLACQSRLLLCLCRTALMCLLPFQGVGGGGGGKVDAVNARTYKFLIGPACRRVTS